MEALGFFLFLWAFSDWVRRFIVNTLLAFEDAKRLGYLPKGWAPPKEPAASLRARRGERE